jgi:hypothetical protein
MAEDTQTNFGSDHWRDASFPGDQSSWQDEASQLSSHFGDDVRIRIVRAYHLNVSLTTVTGRGACPWCVPICECLNRHRGACRGAGYQQHAKHTSLSLWLSWKTRVLD